MRGEHVDAIDERKATAFENAKTFGRACDELVSQSTLKTAELNGAKFRHHEMLTELRRFVNAQKVRENELVRTIVVLHELFHHGCKVAVQTRQMQLLRIKTKAASLMAVIEINEFEL